MERVPRVGEGRDLEAHGVPVCRLEVLEVLVVHLSKGGRNTLLLFQRATHTVTSPDSDALLLRQRERENSDAAMGSTNA